MHERGGNRSGEMFFKYFSMLNRVKKIDRNEDFLTSSGPNLYRADSVQFNVELNIQ